jgi:hypothetical protein
MRLGVAQFTCALLGASACLSAQTRSVINGTVLDENGNPVASATIRMIRLAPWGKVVRSDSAGERGEFAIEGLAWGTYMLSAVKERDAYPEGLWDLYANGPRTTVALSHTSPAVSVTIRIGPRAGVLAATVIDAVTGKEVQSAHITIRRYDNRKVYATLSPFPELLLLPLTKVLIEVHAEGYADWFYPGGGEERRAEAVSVGSGQRLPLIVALQPIGQP